MSEYEEFEEILFSFGFEAAQKGGQAAVSMVDYGHMWHFEDVDAIRFLEKNAAKLSEATLDRLKGNLDQTIIQAVREGKPIREVIKDVDKIFDNMAEYETERIARTEIARGVSNGALVGYGDMGIKIVEWVANAGACTLCMERHEDLMSVDQAWNEIPLHPNCYCFWIPRPDITGAEKT